MSRNRAVSMTRHQRSDRPGDSSSTAVIASASDGLPSVPSERLSRVASDWCQFVSARRAGAPASCLAGRGGCQRAPMLVEAFDQSAGERFRTSSR